MRYLLVVVLSSVVSMSVQADEGQLKDINAFVNKYCVSCHNEKLQEADRRFDNLSSDAIRPAENETWHEILDRLNLGDMPPEDAKLQPSDAERTSASEMLTHVLSSIKERQRKPPTALRRLNRREYDAAMRSLLGLEGMLEDPTSDFTPDEKHDHFQNVGDSLVLSDFLLTRYLEASDRYLNQARARSAEMPEPSTQTFKAPFCRSMPNPDGLDREGEYQHIRENATYRHGYLRLKKLWRGVKTSGRYRIRVKASAINRNYPYKDWIIDVPREDPLRLSIVAADTRTGDMSTNNSTDRVLAVMDVADDEPQWYQTTAWLDQHYQPRFGYPNGPAKIKYMRHLLMREHRDQFPTYLRDRVHIFQTMHPDYDRKTAPALEKIFLDEQERLKNEGKPYDVFGTAHRCHTEEAWMQFYREYLGPRLRIFEVQIEGPLPEDKPNAAALLFPRQFADHDAEQKIADFASQAYRRSTTESERQPIVELYKQQRQQGAAPLDALQVSYQAILCSPAFLYHRTKAGELDDHELASRLSFALWSAPPDQELRNLADSGKLTDARVLYEQTERLLIDSRSEQMIANFTNAWLQLSRLGTMLPDRVEHPGYYNEGLEEAMRTETRMFISDAIKRDLPTSVLVDSDYSFLNSSLARLYGIKGVSGHEFRKVNFSDDNRGGLLGQASVLTASANGIDTSPVLRGVWVMECLLGTPPSPPPPDIEPLEPDIRGATTIREQLAKHRTVATCNQCHRRIDPPGFALESFDPVGRFRKNYKLPGYTSKPGPAIDPSGRLSSGEEFANVKQLKAQFLKRLELVTNNFATKFMVHATGRIDDPQDKTDTLQAIQQLKATRLNEKLPNDVSDGLGLRRLIHAVIQSPAFRR